jgi:Spy/CpxP family protein refolding chaperone
MIHSRSPRTRYFACISVLAAVLSAPVSLMAQSPQALQNIQKVATALNLTPEQKQALIPILKAEAPRIKAIKSNQSLSGMQKIQQIRAVHEEVDPQVRAILTPQQYQQLQQIRAQEIQQVIKSRMAR